MRSDWRGNGAAPGGVEGDGLGGGGVELMVRRGARAKG